MWVNKWTNNKTIFGQIWSACQCCELSDHILNMILFLFLTFESHLNWTKRFFFQWQCASVATNNATILEFSVELWNCYLPIVIFCLIHHVGMDIFKIFFVTFFSIFCLNWTKEDFNKMNNYHNKKLKQ